MTKNAIVALVLAVTVARVAGQAADFALQRFGSLSVSDVEVAQIADLVVSTGKRPWLLRSPHTMELDVRLAYLFLEPDLTGARVHRGRLLTLRADGAPYSPPRSPWRLGDSRSYAYIPSQGRRAGEIRSERDSDWPFTVQGEFDDETLISLVDFIRSQPHLPMVPAGQAPQQVSGAPISVIARRSDNIFIGLRTGDLQGEDITVVRQNGQWVITDFGMWIA